MIIKQLSIFLNNAVGRLSEVTSVLSEAKINLRGLNLSESSDFGILRLVTDDNDRAFAALQAHGFAVSITDVVFIELDDNPGALSAYIKKLSDAGVSVEYMYAFSKGNSAFVVIRSEDIALCDEIVS